MPTVRRSVIAVAVAALLPVACTGPSGDPVTDRGADPSPAPAVTSPWGPSAGGTSTVVHSTRVPPLHPSVDDYPTATVELVAGDGTVHRLAVLRAVTLEQRQHGLMEVPDVPAGTGMVFAYDTDRDGAFTMRGTLTPLQIAWADADGTIVAMADMTPCESEPCPTWPPDAVYRTALEVRAGWLDTVGVGLGDRLVVVGDG